MKPQVAIFDIDGTLADTGHRAHFLAHKPKDYVAFYAAMVDDEPREAVCALLRAVAKDYRIVLCTGRPDSYRRETQTWLMDNFLPFQQVYMRDHTDHRDDAVVKREMLGHIRTWATPIFAIDDRAKVVAMWRAEGLTCFQCAEGDF